MAALHRFRMALAAGLLAFGGPAGSQELRELKRLSLEELLDVPIEAATSLAQRPSEVPSSAYVVTEETIRDRGYSTLLELLEDLPQFEVQHKNSETRRNILSVRGLFGNERLVILYDGIRVTPPSGDIYALGTQFSLRNAKRVEIVVGPMSALYGPDAFSGVINIVTRTGGELRGARLSGAYGQYDTQDASLAFGVPLGTLAFAGAPFLSGAELSVTVHRFASKEPFFPGRFPGDYAWFNNQYQAGFERTSPFAPPDAVTSVPVRPYDAGTGSMFLHSQLKLGDLALGYLRMREHHPSATGVKPDFSLYVKEAVFESHYSTFYGKHSYVSDDERWRLATDVSYHLYEIDPRSRFINTFSLYRDAFKYAFDRTMALREQIQYKVTDASTLILGVSYDDHSALAYTADLPAAFDTSKSLASQGFLYPGSDVIDLNGRSLGIPIDFHLLQYQNLGAFFQLQLGERPSLQPTLGLRYDHNTRYGDSLNPRAGVVWRPVERLALKLNYGEAFLAPSPFRSHAHFGSFSPATNGLGQITGLQSFFFLLPNPGLKPEKLRELESEASYRFTDSLWGALNGYYTETTDLIQDDVVTGPGTFKGWPIAAVASSVNRGFARSYGATARLDALGVLGAWTLKPNAAYTYSAGSVAGNILSYSAKHSVQAGVQAGRGKLTLYPHLIYRARSYNTQKDPAGNPQSSAPYVLVNLFARWSDLVTHPVRLSSFLSVANLTDLRYRNPGFTVSTVGFPAVPQDPIRVVGGVVIEF